MLVKVSISIIFLLLISTQVLSQKSSVVENSDISEIRNVRQVGAGVTPILGSGTILRTPSFSQPLVSSGPRVSAVAGFNAALRFTRPLGVAAAIGADPFVQTAGILRAPTTRVGAFPPLQSRAGILRAPVAAVPLATVVQPNLVTAGSIRDSSIVELPSKGPVTPILSLPGIRRVGRSMPDSEPEAIIKPSVLTKKIQAAAKLEADVHQRVKRQYFKPSIDGSMLSNDRSHLLKASNESKSATTTAATTTKGHPKKPKITVAGLIHSLFQLFDGIKSVLKKALDEHESE